MIPKIIHYCWFGPKEYCQTVKECINSWKIYKPDYEFKLWNESNFDYTQCKFSNQAYINKKWAFVSDYARVKILYDEGGIYFDTDIEALKRFDELLKLPYVFSLEIGHRINTGVIMCEPHNPFIKKILDWYESHDFTDSNEYDDLVKFNNVRIFTEFSKDYTLNKFRKPEEFIYNDSILNVMPNEYFNPMSTAWYKYSYTIHRFTNYWKIINI